MAGIKAIVKEYQMASKTKIDGPLVKWYENQIDKYERKLRNARNKYESDNSTILLYKYKEKLKKKH